MAMGLEYKCWSSKSRMDQGFCMWDKDTDAIGAGVDAAQATLKQQRSKGRTVTLHIYFSHTAMPSPLSSTFLRANVD